jgi:hypothetical protein
MQNRKATCSFIKGRGRAWDHSSRKETTIKKLKIYTGDTYSSNERACMCFRLRPASFFTDCARPIALCLSTIE